MIPTEWRDLAVACASICPSRIAKLLDSAAQIAAIEQDDRSGDEVHGSSPDLLVLGATITKTAKPVKGNRPCKRIAGFALVEFRCDQFPQLWVFKPPQGKQGALDPANLAHRGGQTVLLFIGRELFQDQRRGDHLVPHGGHDLMDVIPVAPDEIFIKPLPEERGELPISGAWLEGVELYVG